MFEDELAGVGESFRGLGRAREGVRARGGGADEATLALALRETERLRRAADALELTILGQSVRFEDQWVDGRYEQVQLPVGQVGEFAAEAVAVLTKAGVHEAGERCDLAARAVTDLAPLTDLLAQGRIRARSMGIVARETVGAGPEAVDAVLEHLLDSLRGKPGSVRIEELDERELRKAVRRLLERTQPELLAERAARNRKDRLDVRFYPGDVGTADMRATLKTEDALVLKEAVEQAAAERRKLDPSLTAAASRAHGLLDLALRGVEVSAHVRLGIPVITSAASRLTFAPFTGGEAGGEASEIAQALHGPTVQQGGYVTGEGADVVEVLPEEWAGEAVTSQVPMTCGPGGPAAWTSGCEIPGVGFIPADVVSYLVTHLETRVSRALIDARTGVLVETSNPRYSVTDSMREFVAARDGTCRMWGCNRRVLKTGCTETNADLDHATEWPQGPSCPRNLSGLCRHHHRLKHLPSWTHALAEDGTTVWTSPTGDEVRTFPELWVHVGEDGSPPVEGAKREPERWELTEEEELTLLYQERREAILERIRANAPEPTEEELAKIEAGEPPF